MAASGCFFQIQRSRVLHPQWYIDSLSEGTMACQILPAQFLVGSVFLFSICCFFHLVILHTSKSKPRLSKPVGNPVVEPSRTSFSFRSALAFSRVASKPSTGPVRVPLSSRRALVLQLLRHGTKCHKITQIMKSIEILRHIMTHLMFFLPNPSHGSSEGNL